MKKRWVKGIACLLWIVILIGTIPVHAETPDLTAMNDSEIVALFDRLADELVSRGIEKTATLARGTYIAGLDIPVGRYVYTCLAKGDDWGSVTVYSDRGKGEQLLWNVVSAPEKGNDPDTIYITLNEGDELKSGVPFSLTVMAGVAFR